MPRRRFPRCRDAVPHDAMTPSRTMPPCCSVADATVSGLSQCSCGHLCQLPPMRCEADPADRMRSHALRPEMAAKRDRRSSDEPPAAKHLPRANLRHPPQPPSASANASFFCQRNPISIATSRHPFTGVCPRHSNGVCPQCQCRRAVKSPDKRREHRCPSATLANLSEST